MSTTLATRNETKPALPGYALRLDDASVRGIGASYPGEIREDLEWLAVYVRENCNRQLAVLCGILKKLGAVATPNLFYKIFTGRYFMADPKRPGRTIGSPANFRQMVGKLRAHFRVEQATGKIAFIETPTWELINNYITVRRSPERICKFGVIIAATGAQVTACGKEYVRQNNHGKCVHLEAPHGGSMSQFITDLAAKYGASVWSNQQNKLAMITSSVTRERTIIVDNVQRLYDPKQRDQQTVFSFLQKLQDDTDCTVILIFKDIFEQTLLQKMSDGFFEQFEGRCGGRGSFLRLPDYAEREDVLAICRGFKLQFDEQRDIEYLEKLAHAKGRIRILFQALQDAQALAGELQRPTMDHVREARGEEVK